VKLLKATREEPLDLWQHKVDYVLSGGVAVCGSLLWQFRSEIGKSVETYFDCPRCAAALAQAEASAPASCAAAWASAEAMSL
jgi:hypothetical protein